MRHFFLLEFLVLYRKAIFNLKIFKNKYLRYQEIVQFSLEVFVTDFFAIIFFFFLGYCRNFILVEGWKRFSNSM